jgi:hypothetical protein
MHGDGSSGVRRWFLPDQAKAQGSTKIEEGASKIVQPPGAYEGKFSPLWSALIDRSRATRSLFCRFVVSSPLLLSDVCANRL